MPALRLKMRDAWWQGQRAPDAAMAAGPPAGDAAGAQSWLMTLVIVLVAAAIMLVPFSGS